MALRKQAGEKETITESATQLLEHEILRGVLQPGSRLAVVDLSNRYEIGVTPIREALSRLVALDLVEAIGRRGFHVKELSFEDLRDNTMVRFTIEREALEISMRKGGDAWESDLIASLHLLQRFVERTGPEFGQGDEELDTLHHNFHRALIGGSGSPRLADFAHNLYNQAYRYRMVNMSRLREPVAFLEMHRTLADAALRRDEKLAVELLCDHLRSTQKNIYPEQPFD